MNHSVGARRNNEWGVRCRDDLNIGQCLTHGGQKESLPARVQVRIDFVQQKNSGALFFEFRQPRDRILAHHEIGNPSNGAANSVRKLRKVQGMISHPQEGLKVRLDVHVETNIFAVQQPKCGLKSGQGPGVMLGRLVTIAGNSALAVKTKQPSLNLGILNGSLKS